MRKVSTTFFKIDELAGSPVIGSGKALWRELRLEAARYLATAFFRENPSSWTIIVDMCGVS